MKSLFVFIILLCKGNYSTAQNQQILSISDTVPDVKMKMINYTSDFTKVSDFRGKLLILDFWSTWCTSCIAEFEHLGALQKEFGDSIAVIPITGYRTAEHNKQFFEKRKSMGKPIQLPSVVEDTILCKLMDLNGVPLEIWIDEHGIIKAITDQYAVTSKNIKLMLEGKEVNLPLHRFQRDFDYTKPLLVNGNGGADSEFIYRSMLTRYNDKIRPIEVEKSKTMTRLFFLNQSVIDLYRKAYTCNSDKKCSLFESAAAYSKFKRIKIVNNDKLLNIEKRRENMPYEEVEPYRQNNLYCYELILPPAFSTKDAYSIMITDLDKFFKIKSSIQKRKTKCLTLTRLPNFNPTINKKNDQTITISDDELSISLRQYPLSVLFNHLNLNTDLPFITDSTGFEGSIDIDMKLKNPKDLASLKEQLKHYGIGITISDALMDTLVLEQQ